MAFQLPTEVALELRRVFLKELETGYQEACEAQPKLLVDSEARAALETLENLFHRIAGSASAGGFSTLGYLTALCEDVAATSFERGEPPAKVAPLLALGIDGIASVLHENHLLSSAPPQTATASEPFTIGTELSGEERAPWNIVVIDDDPVSARLIDGCLRSAGFQSFVCCEAEHALTTIENELPDLIILDVVMPGVSGFELCRRVRAHPSLGFTPIIFVTRKDDVDQRVRGLEAGGNDYVAKPFEPMELVARVRSHLQRLAALRDMAIRDGLTRCYSHRYFKSRLDQEISRARRYHVDLAVCMLDIDHFKRVNDTYGHQAGDAVLAHLSSVMAAAVRSTDMVARYGGEEFLILLVQAGRDEAEIIAHRIRERVANHSFVVPDAASPTSVQIPVTVSIGVAQLQPQDDLTSLIGRVDAALYEAKNSGRNRVCVSGTDASRESKSKVVG